MFRWSLQSVALVSVLGGTAYANPSALPDVGDRKIVVTQPHQFTPKPIAGKVSPFLYLNRCIGGCAITGGSTNDARSNQSSIPAAGSYTVQEFANVFGQTTM